MTEIWYGPAPFAGHNLVRDVEPVIPRGSVVCHPCGGTRAVPVTIIAREIDPPYRTFVQECGDRPCGWCRGKGWLWGA